MDFDELVAAQGWNDQTVIGLLREYISNQGDGQALDDFAQRKADEENGSTRCIVVDADGDGLNRCSECWEALDTNDACPTHGPLSPVGMQEG